jgi:hypothetical protein
MPTIAIPSLAGVEVGRETTRRNIAYASVVGFLVILVTIVVGGWFFLRADVEDILKVLTVTASVLGGIVGAVIGFYFQTKD